MALLPILEFPDPRLRTRAANIDPAELASPAFQTLFDDMFETMYQAPGITARSGEQVYQEGCLSVPEIFADVTRAAVITVEALDRHGKAFTLEADGLLAVCIQHEMDHLEGKLFVDYLSPLKREMVRKKLAKAKRSAA